MAKILIAAHNSSTIAGLNLNLSGRGHALTFADAELSAWENIATGDFDILIIDMLMPEIDAYCLAKNALFGKPQMHIIFTTGFSAVTMDTYNTPAYAAKPLTSRPFHLKNISYRVSLLMGGCDLPIQALSHHMKEDDNNIIYTDFAS